MFVASSPCLKSVQPVKYWGSAIFSCLLSNVKTKTMRVYCYRAFRFENHYFDNQEKHIWISLILISSATYMPNVS